MVLSRHDSTNQTVRKGNGPVVDLPIGYPGRAAKATEEALQSEGVLTGADPSRRCLRVSIRGGRIRAALLCLALVVFTGCGGGGGDGGGDGDYSSPTSQGDSSSGGSGYSNVRTHAIAIDRYGGPVLDVELPASQDSGGAYVACCDINQDGWIDVVVGPGQARSPAPSQTVRAFDGYFGDCIWELQPFEDGYTGGLRVAAGDVDGDGWPDVVVGRGPGSPPQVRVFSGFDGSVILDFLAYDPSFSGGVFVAAGDLDRDGFAEVVTGPGAGIPSEVCAFSWTGATPPARILSFLAHEASWRGGVQVAVGQVTNDTYPSIITGPGPGGDPWVNVFDGTLGVLQTSFLAYDYPPVGGTFVGTGDVNGDGKDEVLTAGGVRSAQVQVWRGDDGYWLDLFDVGFSSDAFLGYGLSVASGDVDGDGHVDIVVGTGLTDAQ